MHSLKSSLKKVWNDPVGSGLIVSLIIAILSIPFNWVVSLFKGITFKEAMELFIHTKVELWAVFLSIFTFWTVVGYIKKIFWYGSETLEQDRILYKKIKDNILTENLMMYPKGSVFSSQAFKGGIIERITEIIDENYKPSFRFHNPRIEKRKQKLVREVSNLYETTSNIICDMDDNFDLFHVPRDGIYKDPLVRKKAQDKIANVERKLSEAYDDFIIYSKRKLKI